MNSESQRLGRPLGVWSDAEESEVLGEHHPGWEPFSLHRSKQEGGLCAFPLERGFPEGRKSVLFDFLPPAFTEVG